jgi:hypothetical protein
MMRWWWIVVAVALASGCSTVTRPTRPSSPFVAEGAPLPGVRFDGEEVQLREPGMPVSPSRLWQREVQNHVANSLNTLVTADENAPVARTTVTFDLVPEPAIAIGAWKEMTIVLTSTLPDGTVVKSAALSENIDDNVEALLVSGMGITGTVLDITAGVSSIVFFIFQSPEAGLLFIGSLVGGLCLNFGQTGAAYIVAGHDETRWSDLLQRALVQHAKDVRAQIGRGPPLPRTPVPPTPPLSTTPTPTPTLPAADPSDVPPLLEPR